MLQVHTTVRTMIYGHFPLSPQQIRTDFGVNHRKISWSCSAEIPTASVRNRGSLKVRLFIAQFRNWNRTIQMSVAHEKREKAKFRNWKWNNERENLVRDLTASHSFELQCNAMAPRGKGEAAYDRSSAFRATLGNKQVAVTPRNTNEFMRGAGSLFPTINGQQSATSAVNHISLRGKISSANARYYGEDRDAYLLPKEH